MRGHIVGLASEKNSNEWRVIAEIVASVIAEGSMKKATLAFGLVCTLSLPLFSAVYEELSTQLTISWPLIATLASNQQKGQTQ